MPRITCCKDCSERHTACHDSCEKYQAQVKAGNDSLERYREKSRGDYQLKQMYSEKKSKKIKRFGSKLW